MARKFCNHDYQADCVFCGHRDCIQSIDHSYFPLKDFVKYLQEAKVKNPDLDSIKQKVREFYEVLKQSILKMLDNDHNTLQQYLNRFYFSYLNGQKINVPEMCSLVNGKYNGLPQKRLIRMVRNIERQKQNQDLDLEEDSQLLELKQNIQNYIKNFNIEQSVSELKNHLPYSKIILKSLSPLKLRRSTSQISNPEQIDQLAVKTYTFRNVTIKYNSKTLDISNKNITDQELLREMPIVSSFKNLNSLEIRNNKITGFGCRIIVSNLAFIKTLDIRCNKIGDQGVLKIINGMPLLKSLMISQTGCTNSSARAIINQMDFLEMLWCQHNSIDGEHAVRVAQKKTLRVLSFAGNMIGEQDGKKIKKIFNSKGYVVI